MRRNTSFTPWFAPKLSQALCSVIRNIGHRISAPRGETLYESPGFFQKLMLVEEGIVAKALLDPFHADPLLLSLSGPGALCGSYETLYLQDRMTRQHWCMTSARVIVVNADLLLRLCDQNIEWQRELGQYCSRCAISDRLGFLVAHNTSPEERLGVFLVATSMIEVPDFYDRLLSSGIEWLALGALPSAKVLTGLLNLSVEQIHGILRDWAERDEIRYRSHKILLSRKSFLKYWRQVTPLLQTADIRNASVQRLDMPVRDCQFPDPVL